MDVVCTSFFKLFHYNIIYFLKFVKLKQSEGISAFKLEADEIY